MAVRVCHHFVDGVSPWPCCLAARGCGHGKAALCRHGSGLRRGRCEPGGLHCAVPPCSQSSPHPTQCHPCCCATALPTAAGRIHMVQLKAGSSFFPFSITVLDQVG